jgi:DNA (cytosine-5)-methyltransferase 1
MLRAIREIQPRWVVGENVFGLVNWSDGMVFDEVQTDLEAEGYEVQPYVLPAVACDAPHRRDRIWFVAHSLGLRCGGGAETTGYDNPIGGRELVSDIGQDGDQVRCETPGCGGINSHSNGIGLERGMHKEGGKRSIPRHDASTLHSLKSRRTWQNFPTQSPICGGDDGLPTELDGITFSKWRQESVKAYGNAIVPQVAYQIFQAIQAYEDL